MAGVGHRFVATEAFWENFHRLPPIQKEATRAAWSIFKLDPFDPRLRTHRALRLTSIVRRPMHAAVIEADLHLVFYVEDNLTVAFNLGSHGVYKT